ncbi:unnamed protein product [Lampetra planeri]
MSGRSAVLHRVSVFALQDAGSADLVAGLALARPGTGRGAARPGDAEPEASPAPTVPAEEAARERAGAGTGGEEGGERGGCSACRCQFESREEQVEHYKLDWHRFNLKQRLAGAATVSAEEFEERTGDISSISGSESDSDSEPWDSEPDPSQPRDLQPRGTQHDGKTEEEEGGPARQSLRVLFTNRAQQTLSLHRCVLHRKQETAQDVDAVGRVLALDARTKWAVLLAGGGHFAGAVFQGDTVLEHKTFHRYTVRAKRGTAQGLRDGQSRGNAPKSAGASLRRYNEAALARDVRELLERWAPLLREADGVFVRAASYSRALLFGACAPLLARDDARVRAVPFATRRATHAEVVRVHRELAAVLVYAKGTDVAEVASPGRRAWRRAGRAPETAGTAAQPAVPSHGAGGTGDDADDDDDDDGDVTLQTSEECLSTAHLSEYDLQPSRAARRRAARNNNNKQKKQQQQPQQQQIDLSEGQEERRPKGAADPGYYRVRDELYTACKVGDAGTLRRILGPLLPRPVDPHPHDLPPPEGSSPLPVDSASGSPRAPSGGQPHAPESTEERGRLAEGAAFPECSAEAVAAMLAEAVGAAGWTLLHVAAASGQRTAARLLMEAGADPTIRDRKGRPAYCASADKETRHEFRRYAAQRPGKYDYARAQIPGPLTDEMESDRAERKRAQRAARRVKDRDQREEQRRQEAEDAETRRFASLSDREKRALAAEKRLAQQGAATSAAAAPLGNIRRCWQCGQSLQEKTPFEYFDFSFCTIACLQQHKRSGASAKP